MNAWSLAFWIASGLFLIGVIGIGLLLLTSCTLSFQNISTHGTASDLVDENQSTEPTVNPNITLPIKAL